MKLWQKILVGLLALVVLLAVMGFAFRQTLGRIAVDHFTKELIGPRPAFRNTDFSVETEWVTMRDGTKLSTDIYTPDGDGPWPTLLVRDAYQFQKYLTCHYYVRYGYACVHQDVRGQGESEGEWYPLKHEADDGADTLEWLTGQHFQNGNIALVGGSYLGLVQWAVADRLPPEVKTIVPTTSHGGFYDMVYRGGHFTQGIAGLWSAEIFHPLQDKEAATKQWLETVIPVHPASDAPKDLFMGAWPSYSDYIAHPDRDDAYWQQDFYRQIDQSYLSVQVPVLWIARWHDFFLEGTLNRVDDLPSRADSLLLIQPGQHGGLTNELNYTDKRFQEFETNLAWLDHHLKGEPLPETLQHPVIYYENGADRWQTADSWPPADRQSLQFHLTRLDQSATCRGSLAETAPSSPEAAAQYTYDPATPVETKGGAFLLNPNIAPPAIADQGRTACERDDILSFVSEPFDAGLHIAGSIEVSLDVQTDAPETAFTVKISEVFEDGRVLNIRDDIQTYRPASTPDDAALVFDLVPIDWTLAPGSRLRLDVSSSNFPAFPAHPNKAGVWSEIASPATARQTLSGGSVKLPIIKE
ncbi:CocE/NonD family hydrolase [Henriciella sp. AS95]|uniref:CocE/NonD family hydrolase n=1 Tax=Henriciella sp. AS95 TaxID=3135782 RepID=UPI003178DC57